MDGIGVMYETSMMDRYEWGKENHEKSCMIWIEEVFMDETELRMTGGKWKE